MWTLTLETDIAGWNLLLKSLFPLMSSFPQPFLLPICRYPVNLSKTRIEVQPQNWSYHQTQLGGHASGSMRGMVGCRGEGRSWNACPRWRMALVGISPPWLAQLTPLRLGPSYTAAHSSSSLGHGQPNPHGAGVSVRTPHLSLGNSQACGLCLVNLIAPSPTSVRDQMTSHGCCYNHFSLMFSRILQC